MLCGGVARSPLPGRSYSSVCSTATNVYAITTILRTGASASATTPTTKERAQMPRSWEDFYTEVERARNLLVDASVWYAAKMTPLNSPAVKTLNTVVSGLVGWCDENIPETPF